MACSPALSSLKRTSPPRAPGRPGGRRPRASRCVAARGGWHSLARRFAVRPPIPAPHPSPGSPKETGPPALHIPTLRRIPAPRRCGRM